MDTQPEDRRLGQSLAQKFWTLPSQRHGHGHGLKVRARRVAMVRPNRSTSVRHGVLGRKQMPGTFRLSVQSPVLQTRLVISRIRLLDGTILEETLHDRFVMARTIATQTPREGVMGGAEVELQTEESSPGESSSGSEDDDSSDESPGAPVRDERE